ncbi:Kinase superfamily protein isoform 2 [Hibiscus syriacus]|uniref:Kinase superfamily protein isoform 2 n=1 Tax=Hibiscus syriacus TaxID=106335 RepID=A0A6A3BS21_HIBSY|nr:Kinase superfamily protein isoform 2 [Hibiscus syriacus]
MIFMVFLNSCFVKDGIWKWVFAAQDLSTDSKWLIDPQQLFVGPKIGEVIGACKEPMMVIVTELLLGGTLRKFLLNMRPKCLDMRVAIGFALDIAHHRTVKLADFGLAREESLTEMMTAEMGRTDGWLLSFIARSRMSNLQAAYAAAFKNIRPSADDLPGDLALIVTSSWQEDPNARPNFSQIIEMLLHYISVISPPELVMPPKRTTSENAVLPPESPGTSSLMAARDDVGKPRRPPRRTGQEVSSSALNSVTDPSMTQFRFSRGYRKSNQISLVELYDRI